MPTLNTLIARGDGAPPWRHLVVVGAGDGQRAAAWSTAPALRRDLVEADPQRAALLQRAHGARPSTQVWPDVVAPASGPVTWHRHQPDFLDGVFDARELREVYPRLQCLGRQDVDGTGLGELLARLGVQPESPHDRLLIVDVPGARRLLGAAAGHPALQGCGRIAVRDVLDPLDGPADEIDAVLGAQGFAAEPLEEGWRAYRRDADLIARLELARAADGLRERCTDLERRLGDRDREVAELRADRDRLGREAGLALERAGMADHLAAETRRVSDHDVRTARQEADELRARAERLTAELQARAVDQDRLAEQVRQTRALLGERDAELARDRAERARLDADTLRQAGEAAAREAALQAECEAQSARAHAAEAARAAAEDDRRESLSRGSVATERAQQLERKLAETEAVVQALQRDKQSLTTERDTAQKALQDKTRRVQALEAEVADVRTRLDLMAQEIGRAEGQLDVLKELFLQETSL